MNGAPVFYKDWHSAGVIFVKDLVSQNKFLNYNNFCMKYSVRTNILLYLGLLAAIPVEWKRIIFDRCDHVDINQDVIEKSYISISNIDLCKKQQSMYMNT